MKNNELGQRQGRREFLGRLTWAAGALALPAGAWAAKPWDRKEYHFTGLSLAAYSMRKFMHWSRDKEQTGTMDMFQFLDYCAGLGIAGAELTAYFFPPEVDGAYCRRIKRHAQVLGLDLTGGAIGNKFSYAPGSAEAQKELDYTRKWIDLYAEMGVPVIRVFAGQPAKGQAPEEAVANIRANLPVALEHAEKRGVLLGLENHDFTSDVNRFVEIIESVDSPWLGATLDSANVQAGQDPYEQLERIAPYALTAQIKVGFTFSTPEGKVKQPMDFAKVIDLLKKHRYRGYVVLEYEEDEGHEERIPQTLAELKKLIA